MCMSVGMCVSVCVCERACVWGGLSTARLFHGDEAASGYSAQGPEGDHLWVQLPGASEGSLGPWAGAPLCPVPQGVFSLPAPAHLFPWAQTRRIVFSGPVVSR